MKIIGLVASPRGEKSTTRKLVAAALEGAASSGASTRIVDMSRLKIGQCKDCGDCFKSGSCIQEDDLPYLLRCMLDSDGIIMGSPAYASGGVTSVMEAFTERMGEAWHCLLLEGKYGMVLSVSGDGGEDLAIAHMSDFLMACGVLVVGGAGAALQRRGSMEEGVLRARELGNDLAIAIKTRRHYGQQEGTHAAFIEKFGIHITANRDRWAHDHEYWIKKGWIH
ncbi:MAG TPA: flavodoxin family protein [Methanocellaceae archaeon]|jgi:multimeric flavodoxin WrbA